MHQSLRCVLYLSDGSTTGQKQVKQLERKTTKSSEKSEFEIF